MAPYNIAKDKMA